MKEPKDEQQQKIKGLLKSRKKMLDRVKRINAIFQEEKENEESWPGHESTKYQMADSDCQVFLNHLVLIDEELKNLGVNLKDYEKDSKDTPAS